MYLVYPLQATAVKVYYSLVYLMMLVFPKRVFTSTEHCRSISRFVCNFLQCQWCRSRGAIVLDG